MSFALAAVATLSISPQSAPTTAHDLAHVHSRTPQMRILVPAYFYPVPGSPWTRMNAAASAHPGRIVAIANPSNGPGTSSDPSYVSALASFRASGGTLIGYVFTSYGARPIASVESDVDQWFAWYGVDGIFFDEMDNVAGAHESYYAALHQHVRSHLATALVIGNPGTSTVSSYLSYPGGPVASAVCIYEDGNAELTWTADAWVHGRDRRHFVALAHTTPLASWQAAVDHAWQQNCGYVFATSDVLPNPWDILPSYFEAMASYVDATY